MLNASTLGGVIGVQGTITWIAAGGSFTITTPRASLVIINEGNHNWIKGYLVRWGVHSEAFTFGNMPSTIAVTQNDGDLIITNNASSGINFKYVVIG